MGGIVKELYIAEKAGSAPDSQASVIAEAGRGLVGDRYYQGQGTFSEKLKGTHDVELTLIESEEIDQFNAIAEQSLNEASFRRNLVTQGIRLNDLVGEVFWIGETKLKGLRLCEPCAYLAGILGDDIMKHMVHKCGIRAQILTDGEILVNDEITVRR